MKLIKEKILIEFHFSIYDINGLGTTCLTINAYWYLQQGIK